MKFRFPIVIIDEDFRSENTSGLGIRALAEAIEGEGYEVMGATSYGDLSQFAQQQSRASAFILSIDDEEFTPGPDLDPAVLNLRNFIEEVRRKNADVPIYVYGETKTSRHLPNDILRELHGFIHMFEDTPEFVARHIIREAKSYLESVQPPFFKALLDYAEDGSYSWHCPGHSGGVAFLKSPVGQMYHQFYGENMLRADVCNAVEELGQLLDHNGAIGESERNAARIFNADHCFFVTNGTSTSNKMVWHHTVAPDDVVVVDRNCHKSVLHAIIMTGAVPVFLKPTRNHYGIIGPIPQSEFEPTAIQAKIKKNPLLNALGVNWSDWEGDVDDTDPPSQGELPYVQVSPQGGPTGWFHNQTHVAEMSITFSYVLDGTSVDEGHKFWRAIERAYFPADGTVAGVQAALLAAGISSVEITSSPTFDFGGTEKAGRLLGTASKKITLYLDTPTHA